jgi:NADPH-dependent 2,4-dienoyl-CoA reductase/sulfur reductase-like enzyme
MRWCLTVIGRNRYTLPPLIRVKFVIWAAGEFKHLSHTHGKSYGWRAVHVVAPPSLYACTYTVDTWPVSQGGASTGEFQYPRCDGFPGAELCMHNSSVRSWAAEVALAKAASERADKKKRAIAERLVIGGYESGMDATVNLAALGVSVTVVASVPYWSQRTLDPSTELAPHTAGETHDPPQSLPSCKLAVTLLC